MHPMLDRTDLKMLRLLQRNGRLSNADLAKKAAVSEPGDLPSSDATSP